MDAHFHAYKAKYELLDEHIKIIQRSQYIREIDIFINLDDIFHIMHRPLVEKEVQAYGINAVKHCAVHIVNTIAHYKWWASKRRIRSRVFAVYTSNINGFKNSVYLPTYRDHYSLISDPFNQKFFLTNDTIRKAIPIAKSICDYVDDVFMIDSRHMEPSIVPLALVELGIANYTWKMMVSRDTYDLQYAYRDGWIFVSPKGDNTSIVTRGNLWQYIAQHEKVREIAPHVTTYDHDIYPLALTINGDRYRGIPRLQRIGWKTIFKYMNSVTEIDTSSLQILSSRFLDLLGSKGVQVEQIQNNLSCVSIPSQVNLLSSIDTTLITDQLKYVSDHDALNTINELYFKEFPINIPFLTTDFQPSKPFY